MGKEQACPFSLKAEIIGIANSVRHGKVSLTKRLRGTVDNLRSTRNENQDQLAYSDWEYQEGADRKGRPDLIHPRFGSMTDSLLCFVALQSSPEGRKMAKFQLRQWRLIKEAALDLQDGEIIYALIPRMIEIEDGAALMRLKKDGNRFLAQSRLLPQDFDQEKAKLLFGRLKEKGLVIKSLSKDEPSPIFQIAKGGKEKAIDLKDDLPQILIEPFQSVLTQAVQESLTLTSWAELPELAPFSLLNSVFQKDVGVYQPALEKAAVGVVQETVILAPGFIAAPQGDKEEASLNQLAIFATAQRSSPNLQSSPRNGQSTTVEENELVKENKPVREDKKISLREEQTFGMEQQELAVATEARPIKRKKAIAEVSASVHPGGVNREEVVIFEAAEPVMKTTITEPFAFIPERWHFLESTEETHLSILFVPNNIEEVEQIVCVEGENSPDLVSRMLPIRDKDLVVPHKEMIEGRISKEKASREGVETKEERVVLPKVEVRVPKVVRLNFPLSLFSSGRKETIPEVLKSFHPRGIKPLERYKSRWPSWIELLSPKEMGMIAALARDKFGINDSFSFSKMADSILFWLLGTSLFAPRPILYKLELDLTPLIVRVKEGKYIVASSATSEETFGVEELLARERQFPSRPFLFLTA